MTWRDRFRPLIAEVIARHAPPEGERGRKLLRAALLEAWNSQPLESWERHGWPYNVWRDEIKRQLGHGKPADRPRRRIASRALRKLSAAEVREWYARRQLKLFGSEA